MRRLAFAALVSLLVLLGTASAPGKPLSEADRAFVDATVGRAVEAGRLPGFSIEISGPRGSYARTYGVADLRTRRGFRPDDRVRIASITKTFTATAILLQVQRGRLSLGDRLSEFVSGVPNGGRITIRQLLAMRSGIYDFTSDERFGEEFERNPRMRFDLGDVLAIIRRHKPLFEPGARTSYADSNYYLLGAILERVSGMSAARAITEEVIEPLGLKHTSFPTGAAMPRPFSRGYYAGPDGEGPIRDYTAVGPSVAWTAGAMISTVGDLRRYGRALARGALLNPRLKRARLRFGRIPNPSGPPVGYGLGILRIGDWLGHDGAIFGFSTETFYNPRNGAQVVGASNLSSNFSTPTLAVFLEIVSRLYPASLQAG